MHEPHTNDVARLVHVPPPFSSHEDVLLSSKLDNFEHRHPHRAEQESEWEILAARATTARGCGGTLKRPDDGLMLEKRQLEHLVLRARDKDSRLRPIQAGWTDYIPLPQWKRDGKGIRIPIPKVCHQIASCRCHTAEQRRDCRNARGHASGKNA